MLGLLAIIDLHKGMSGLVGRAVPPPPKKQKLITFLIKRELIFPRQNQASKAVMRNWWMVILTVARILIHTGVVVVLCV
jgi:hypothetical protein